MIDKIKEFVLDNWKPALSGMGVGAAAGLTVGVYYAQGRIGTAILAIGEFILSGIKLILALI